MAESTTSQAKDRQYAQLSKSISRLSEALSQSAELLDDLNGDLHAMRTLGAIHASTFMAAVELSEVKQAGEPKDGAA